MSFDRHALPAESYADILAKALFDCGSTHDSTDVDISSLHPNTRDLTEPDLIHCLIVQGIKSDGFTHDIAFNHYRNAAKSSTLAAQRVSSDKPIFGDGVVRKTRP